MRRRLTPELVRIVLWVGCLAYCALLWCWLRIEDLRHPVPA